MLLRKMCDSFALSSRHASAHFIWDFLPSNIHAIITHDPVLQIDWAVAEIVKEMDNMPVSTGRRTCQTVDTFVHTNRTATAAIPLAQNSHFTVRENYHDIEALLLEGRPGDACLPSIISKASAGSQYAALFSGVFHHCNDLAPLLFSSVYFPHHE